MDSQAFTLFHVVLSLLGIASGLIVLYGLLKSQRMPALTWFFLLTTIATSATGYFFERDKILPSHIVGAISLAVLALAVVALYFGRLRGAWRATYVITAVIGLYLNMFVLVAQSFLKIPALHELAPTGQEPPFAIGEGIVLLIFIVLGVLAVKRFRPH